MAKNSINLKTILDSLTDLRKVIEIENNKIKEKQSGLEELKNNVARLKAKEQRIIESTKYYLVAKLEGDMLCLYGTDEATKDEINDPSYLNTLFFKCGAHGDQQHTRNSQVKKIEYRWHEVKKLFAFYIVLEGKEVLMSDIIEKILKDGKL